MIGLWRVHWFLFDCSQVTLAIDSPQAVEHLFFGRNDRVGAAAIWKQPLGPVADGSDTPSASADRMRTAKRFVSSVSMAKYSSGTIRAPDR